jgi:hypothetical protein
LALGLGVIGTLGVLLAAKRKRLITEVHPLVDELLRQGFWVSPRGVRRLKQPVFLFDSHGLGLLAVVGPHKALLHGSKGGR